MASRMNTTGRDLERLHREWMERSEQAFQRMFGEDQQKNLVTFSEREGRAVEIGRELSRSLIEEHIASDPAAQPSLHCERAGTPDVPGCPRGSQGGARNKSRRGQNAIAGESGEEKSLATAQASQSEGEKAGADDGGVHGQL